MKGIFEIRGWLAGWLYDEQIELMYLVYSWSNGIKGEVYVCNVFVSIFDH